MLQHPEQHQRQPQTPVVRRIIAIASAFATATAAGRRDIHARQRAQQEGQG